MADGKRRYKSDRKAHKVSVKLSEKDMDILKAALKRTGITASAYIRELIRTGGNIDTSYPEDRTRAIRVIAGIANNINQVVKLGNSQGKLYYSDIDKLQSRQCMSSSSSQRMCLVMIMRLCMRFTLTGSICMDI